MVLAPLRIGLFSLLGVAKVAWFFVADTLLLSLFFDGCFAIVVARTDTLSLMSLQAPPSCRFVVECVMAPSCEYFAALFLADALPSYY
jgi:hypothetical protein